MNTSEAIQYCYGFKLTEVLAPQLLITRQSSFTGNRVDTSICLKPEIESEIPQASCLSEQKEAGLDFNSQPFKTWFIVYKFSKPHPSHPLKH